MYELYNFCCFRLLDFYRNEPGIARYVNFNLVW